MIIVLAIVSLVAGSAVADKQPQRKHENRPVPKSTSIASARAITARMNAIRSGDVKLRRKLTAAVKHKGVVEVHVPLFAVADGNSLYTAKVHAKGTKGEDGDLISIRLLIDRTDRTTGAVTHLLSKFNTYPLGINARAGRVAIETGSVALTELDGKKDPEFFKVKTALYVGGATDAALKPIDVKTFTLDAESEQPCGDLPILGGISDAGDPLVAQVKGDCKRGPGPSDTLQTELEVWKADGTRHGLGPTAVDDVLYGGEYVYTGTKLLAPNPYMPATELRDVPSGTAENVWTPGVTMADLAADGTVALVGTPAAREPFPFPGVYYGTDESTTVAKSAEDPVPIDGLPTKWKPPIRKYPLVVLPGGGTENPVLVNASRQDIADMKFCGGNLYVVKSLSKNRGYYSGDYSTSVGAFLFFGSFGYGKYEVQLYDTQGHLLRSLVKSHPLAFAGLGCNGDKLLLVVRKGTGFATTEIGT